MYYVVFSWAIKKFDLKTPGREDYNNTAGLVVLKNNDFTQMAHAILDGLGGVENLESVTYCATRLRTEVKDYLLVDEAKIKNAGVPGVFRPSEHNVQVIIGTKVQFVYDEMKKLVDAAK